MRFYEALDLEPKLALDLDDLKRRFYERSRQWHPDRFSRASPEEQEKALEMTAVLNDAFRTLRDPFARASYFFKESGINLPKEAPPDVLKEFFELNMELEELRGGDESVRPQVATAYERILEMRQTTDTALAGLFELYDRNEEMRPTLIATAGDLLNVRRYLANYLRVAGKELHVPLPN
jgi:molecular chaperone HscB